MHIHFLAIGGAGIGPLAQIAHQAGYSVSGSDKRSSSYIDYLIKQGITDIEIGQGEQVIANAHHKNPIDWLVYSSAVSMESSNPPELAYAEANNIKATKRDEFTNQLINDHQLKMIAVAGTHGKTTTTAMLVWLFKQFNKPTSYLLPAKISFGEMGQFSKDSQYFIYEADEFDRNFLAYRPYLSLISGVSWDHHEIFPTREDYIQAFRDFIDASDCTIIWQTDAEYIRSGNPQLVIQETTNPKLADIKLKGLYNRQDAWLAASAFCNLFEVSIGDVINTLNNFPGVSRRMEEIYPGLYTDYAHTPEKIRGAVSAALETKYDNQKLVVVYEPLTNRRQKHMLEAYKDCFRGVDKLYWVDSYLAREDPNDQIIKPEELIAHLDDPSIAESAKTDDKLKETIAAHLKAGDMVVGMAGGGGESLDDWLRAHFNSK
jgi:UDP-N-acetylmuramate--alanine ligase